MYHIAQKSNLGGNRSLCGGIRLERVFVKQSKLMEMVTIVTNIK
jgi:hypothetical protein